MIQEKIKDFLLTIFNEDYIKNNNEYSYKSQILIITIKSLMPSKKKAGSIIDYERYKKEFQLWYYYRNGENNSIINSISALDNKIYWDEFDDTVYTRILPIVLANDKWQVVEEEVIKNTLYTTGKISTLFESLLFSKILYLLLENNEDNIIDVLKDEVIKFSQKDFVNKYSNFYRISPNKYFGNFTVEFEKTKIDAINMLNKLYIGKFPVVEEIIFNRDKGISSYWKAIENLVNREKPKEFKSYFYEDMCNYLYKLRKGYINPEVLKINKYYMPDIFSFNIGDEFFHTLLNKSKVINKKENDKTIEIHVETKSGVYKFLKNKRPSN